MNGKKKRTEERQKGHSMFTEGLITEAQTSTNLIPVHAPFLLTQLPTLIEL
jgi:hypothetical protein